MNSGELLFKILPTRWWHPPLRRASRWLTDLDSRFIYCMLAIGLGTWMASKHYLEREAHLKHSDYDLMMSKRIIVPISDPDIIILDIDERSLAAMNRDFGRWPWPRDVLAATLASLEQQGARAVIFDILFIDRDALNPGADQAFDAAIAKSRHSYFPVIRLPKAADSVSQIKAADLPGLVAVEKPSAASSTLGLVPPMFNAMVKSERLGTINIDLDSDGLVRKYPLWETQDGLRIWSLPARVARDLGWPLPQDKAPLLRFMGHSLAFNRVSFADFYSDTQRSQALRSPHEFKNKIVLIGATAPALLDLKSTPIDRLHPGVEILATAIDNLKNQRFVIEPPFYVQLTISALLLVAMALVSLRWSPRSLTMAFVIAPSALLLLTYASLNREGRFLDLSAVAGVAFLYFAAIKLHHAELARRFAGEQWHSPSSAGVTEILGQRLTLTSAAQQRDLEQRLFGLCRALAPDVMFTTLPNTGMGWIGKDQAKSWMFYWTIGPANQGHSARQQAAALMPALLPLGPQPPASAPDRADHGVGQLTSVIVAPGTLALAKERLFLALLRSSDGPALETPTLIEAENHRHA
jgi:CHASE2 domain-containing sensor protein